MNKQLIIASDHAGFVLKEQLKAHFSNTLSFIDLGTYSEQSVDYPDIMHEVAKEMMKNPSLQAIIICGSGNGVAMTVNKYDYVRCAICWNTELASLAKAHNDANIISLPARFITEKEAIDIVDAYLSTSFEGGRHLTRVNKISK